MKDWLIAVERTTFESLFVGLFQLLANYCDCQRDVEGEKLVLQPSLTEVSLMAKNIYYLSLSDERAF